MAKDKANDPKRQVVFRKGEDQSALWNRAKDQERSHVMSDADSGGYLVGLNENMPVSEASKMGDLPVSAKGIRMGQNALHWQRQSPHTWKNAGYTLADERYPKKEK
jgi:hypothetical protein